MALRIAFVGFRHGHIFALHSLLQSRRDVDIVGACEEHDETRAGLADKGVTVTHASYETMLDDVECDVIACGDYFGIRGDRLVAAMERGRHIIGDKPLCTRRSELDRIEALSRQGNLKVGCMLDLRDSAMLQTLRRLLMEGAIGDVQSVHFNGQHPLLYGTRPMWYFEPGKHGGTINDIAIHAFDALPWLTGYPVAGIDAARVWNARLRQHSEFQDGAVVVFHLANGCTVMGDVSYLGPDTVGYALPAYWRMTFAGSEGFLETAYNATTVTWCRHDDTMPRELPLDCPRPGGYFEDFLADLHGAPNPTGLTTETILLSSRWALEAQRLADAPG